MRLQRKGIEDEEGVTNVVSLIMIGGIIISLLGMIFATYLPAWGKDIEAQTLMGAMDSMMDMKSGMDILAVGGDSGTSLSTKIALGSSGGPVFGFGRMSGSLQLVEGRGLIEVVDQTGTVYAQGRGALVYSSNNLYVEDQVITLEGGAIIRDQLGLGILKANPNIILRRDVNLGTTSLYALIPTLEGDMQSVSGSATYMIETALLSEQLSSYTIGADDISVRVSTVHPEVWSGYFSSICTAQGLVLDIHYRLTEDVDPLGAPRVTCTFLTLDSMDIRAAVYQIGVS